MVGTVLEMQTFVQVRWVWLTLIVLQLGLALIFFIMTVIATRRLGAQVRKSSALETLYALHPNGGLGNEGTKAQMVRQHGNMVLLLSSADPPQQVAARQNSQPKQRKTDDNLSSHG